MQLIRSPGSLRKREGSEALEEEIGVWNFQVGGKDKCLFCCFSLHSLVLFTKIVYFL